MVMHCQGGWPFCMESEGSSPSTGAGCQFPLCPGAQHIVDAQEANQGTRHAQGNCPHSGQ
jgi:hypothetical protein